MLLLVTELPWRWSCTLIACQSRSRMRSRFKIIFALQRPARSPTAPKTQPQDPSSPGSTQKSRPLQSTPRWSSTQFTSQLKHISLPKAQLENTRICNISISIIIVAAAADYYYYLTPVSSAARQNAPSCQAISLQLQRAHIIHVTSLWIQDSLHRHKGNLRWINKMWRRRAYLTRYR